MLSHGRTIVTGWASDTGCVRTENEDSCLVAPQLGVWAVADGMGGHEDGRLASQSIVEELQKIAQAMSAAELMQQCEAAVVAANARLQALSARRSGSVIGSTLVLLLIYKDYYACMWSGDSRLYLIRDDAIRPLTRDHTEVEDLLAQGVLTPAEAERWPNRNVITRAIGTAAAPELEMISGDVRIGDTFILCSDGLTTHVSAAEVKDVVCRTPPQRACDLLVRTTLDRGATDNVTIVVARIEGEETTIVQPALKASGTRADGG